MIIALVGSWMPSGGSWVTLPSSSQPPLPPLPRAWCCPRGRHLSGIKNAPSAEQVAGRRRSNATCSWLSSASSKRTNPDCCKHYQPTNRHFARSRIKLESYSSSVTSTNSYPAHSLLMQLSARRYTARLPTAQLRSWWRNFDCCSNTQAGRFTALS